MKAQYILGLDIGITSVGYGLIDYESKEVIDAGVRLFKEADAENNEGRRGKRGRRRLIRRRKHRLARIHRLLVEQGLLEEGQQPIHSDIYQIRLKGLSEPLAKEELASALLHLAKRRGVHNVDILETEEHSGNELSTKEQLARNQKDLENSFLVEAQLKRFNREGTIRGHGNRYKTEAYLKEAKRLLEIQKGYHGLSDNFIETYLHLVESRREYYEGPGEGSPYGWDGDLKKWYELLMGRCTYFPDELRSVKHAYSADLFNVLNDLNNLTINREDSEKLFYHEKWEIIENLFKMKKTITLRQIAKEIGVEENAITGYRISKSGKPLFTSLKIYHDLKPIVSNKVVLEDAEKLDQIAGIMTIYQSPEDIAAEIKKLDLPITDSELELIGQLSGYTGTHRLSLKCIRIILDELWHTTDNQMAIFTRLKLTPRKVDLSKQNKIPTELLADFIISPVVKRAFTQSIRVVNEVIQQFGLPKDIIIELARESNSKEKQKWINNQQKSNEAANKRIQQIIKEYSNENAKYLFEKIKLHDMQEGKCLYSLQDIPLEDLLRNPSHYEIDHIIPRSVVFDNSLHNKVLVKQIENSKKRNRTPYQYLTSNEGTITYETFKKHVLNVSKSKDRMTKKKQEYLLEERDINKYTVQKDFINRNLVDTRYATRELLTLLTAYFKANELDVKVKTINGGFTNFLRRKWKFKKDRNQGYKHHAEDALIIANVDFIFKSLKKLDEMVTSPTEEVEQKNGEVMAEDQYKEVFESPLQVQAIKDFKAYKYSHRVDKKPNRELINESVYSTREQANGKILRVNKITNIYAKDNGALKKIFDDNAPEKLLMYQHDPKTFEKLELIMKQYSEEKNPLYKYKEETSEYLTKYSKKGNGPIIKSVKYLGQDAGTYYDVTDKYQNSRHTIIKTSKKPYRLDVYHDEDGYKMITVHYLDIFNKKTYYQIDQAVYEEKKKEKHLNKDAQFIASFYRNDLIELDGMVYRLIGVNDSVRNKIELDRVDIPYKDYCKLNNIKNNRLVVVIGKKTKCIKKLTTDILGNQYHIQRPEKIQFIIKKG